MYLIHGLHMLHTIHLRFMQCAPVMSAKIALSSGSRFLLRAPDGPRENSYGMHALNKIIVRYKYRILRQLFDGKSYEQMYWMLDQQNDTDLSIR